MAVPNDAGLNAEAIDSNVGIQTSLMQPPPKLEMSNSLLFPNQKKQSGFQFYNFNMRPNAK